MENKNIVDCRYIVTENGEALWFFQEGLQDAGVGNWGSYLTHSMPMRFKKVHTPSKKLMCNQQGIRWLNEQIMAQLYRETYFQARAKLIEMSIEHQRDGLEPIDTDDAIVLHKISERILGFTFKELTGQEPNDFDMTLQWKSSGKLKLIDERIQEWVFETNSRVPLAVQ